MALRSRMQVALLCVAIRAVCLHCWRAGESSSATFAKLGRETILNAKRSQYLLQRGCAGSGPFSVLPDGVDSVPDTVSQMLNLSTAIHRLSHGCFRRSNHAMHPQILRSLAISTVFVGKICRIDHDGHALLSKEKTL